MHRMITIHARPRLRLRMNTSHAKNVYMNDGGNFFRGICVMYNFFITTHKCGVVMCSVASVCVFVCTVLVTAYESLDLETSFLVCKYISRISRPSSHVKIN